MRNQRILAVVVLAVALGLLGLASAAYRQQQNDSMLITAIVRCDVTTALRCIRDGADSNTQVDDNPPRTAPAVLLRYLERVLSDHKSRPAQGDRSALGTALLAEAMSPDPNRDRQAYDDIAAALVAHGADCSAKIVVSNSPLSVATRLRLHKTVEAMLDRGADANGGSSSGPTPLMGADAETAALLIKHGANVNVRDANGETPLMYACRMPDGSPEIVRLLLGAGADPNAADRRGNQALMLSRDLDVVTMLVDKGAIVNARNEEGRTALDYRIADATVAPLDLEPIVTYLKNHGARQ